MQEKIEAYLKTARGRWVNADEISAATKINRAVVLDGLQSLFRWKAIEKKYEFIDIYPKKRYAVFARIRKQKRN